MSLAPRIDAIETDIKKFDKNIIINSDMDLWQRGFTFTGLGANQVYTADRLQWAGGTTTALLTGSRVTTAGTGNAAILPKECTYAARFAVTTAQAVLSAGSSAAPWLKIEGYDAVEVLGSDVGFTFSFHMRAFRTGVYYVQFGNGTLNRLYCTPVTITASNSWQKVTLFAPTPDTTIDTWNTLNGIGLIVRIWMAAGSNLVGATSNEWFTVSTPQVGADQVNAVQSTSDYIEITGFDLHKGQYDRPYVKRGRSNQEEISLAQRYYEKSFNIYTAPANGPNATSFSTDIGLLTIPVVTWVGSPGQYLPTYRFATVKRTVPAITTYGNNAGLWSYGVAGSFSVSTTRTYVANLNATATGSGALEIINNVTSNSLIGVQGHWAADAEL